MIPLKVKVLERKATRGKKSTLPLTPIQWLGLIDVI